MFSDDFNKRLRANEDQVPTRSPMARNQAEAQADAAYDIQQNQRQAKAAGSGGGHSNFIGTLAIWGSIALAWGGYQLFEWWSESRRQAEVVAQSRRDAPPPPVYLRESFTSVTDNDAYLPGLPRPNRVVQALAGPTALDAALRQEVAFALLTRALGDLVGERRHRAGSLTAAETALKKQYDEALAAARARVERLRTTPDGLAVPAMRQHLARSSALARLVWEQTTTPEWRQRHFRNWKAFEATPEPLLTVARLMQRPAN